MCYHNVRDSKGRFTKSSPTFTGTIVIPSSSVSFDKESCINTLRDELVLVEYEKLGATYRNCFTLKASILGTYQGSGKSKISNPDNLFAYDVNSKGFRVIPVSGINSFTIL